MKSTGLCRGKKNAALACCCVRCGQLEAVGNARAEWLNSNRECVKGIAKDAIISLEQPSSLKQDANMWTLGLLPVRQERRNIYRFNYVQELYGNGSKETRQTDHRARLVKSTVIDLIYR